MRGANEHGPRALIFPAPDLSVYAHTRSRFTQLRFRPDARGVYMDVPLPFYQAVTVTVPYFGGTVNSVQYYDSESTRNSAMQKMFSFFFFFFFLSFVGCVLITKSGSTISLTYYLGGSCTVLYFCASPPLSALTSSPNLFPRLVIANRTPPSAYVRPVCVA
jgi:hypothetical protein